MPRNSKMVSSDPATSAMPTIHVNMDQDSDPAVSVWSGSEAVSVEEQKDAAERSSLVRRQNMFEFLPEVPGAKPPSKPWTLNTFSVPMQFWDVTMMIAMAFTALVTPFEVAFLEFTLYDELFWINRIFDCVFWIDIGLAFFTPFIDPDTGIWETKHRLIAKRYFKGWFSIDAASSIPYDLLSLLQETTSTSSAGVGQLKLLRNLRLLRLAKLLRIFRASRIWNRWSQQLPFSFASMSLWLFGVSVLIMSHWAACLLRIVPQIEDGETDWMKGYFEGSLGLVDVPSTGSVYLAAYYWSVMTLTTIGYGDVTAQTDAERLLLTVLMIIGGGMYAYIVGAVCGIVASMDMLKIEFRQAVDELNMFMKEKKIPKELRVKLRQFFHYTEGQRRLRHYHTLLEDMSPALRGDVSRIINKDWVHKVPFIEVAPIEEREAFITAIAIELQLRAYPPLERIMSPGVTVNEMYIINRGTVSIHMRPRVNPDAVDAETFGHLNLRRSIPVRAFKALEQGNCFGHEIIFGGHKSVYYATTLTYCDISVLTQEKLEEILDSQSLIGTQVNLRAHAARNKWHSLADIKREDSFIRRGSTKARDLASEIVGMRRDLDNMVTKLEKKEKALAEEEDKEGPGNGGGNGSNSGYPRGPSMVEQETLYGGGGGDGQV